MAKRKTAQQQESIHQASTNCKTVLDLHTKDIGAGYPRKVQNLLAVIEALENYASAIFENRLAAGMIPDKAAREALSLIEDEIIGGFGSHRLFQYDCWNARKGVESKLAQLILIAERRPSKAHPGLSKARQKAIGRKLKVLGCHWKEVHLLSGLKPYKEDTYRKTAAGDPKRMSKEARQKAIKFLGITEKQWYDEQALNSLKFK